MEQTSSPDRGANGWTLTAKVCAKTKNLRLWCEKCETEGLSFTRSLRLVATSPYPGEPAGGPGTLPAAHDGQRQRLPGPGSREAARNAASSAPNWSLVAR